MIRVVAADDHAAYLRATTETLKRAGLRVVGVSTTGQGVIDFVRALAPDVALVDLHMPGLSGADVARTVRAELSRHARRDPLGLRRPRDRAARHRRGGHRLRQQGQRARGHRARRLPRRRRRGDAAVLRPCAGPSELQASSDTVRGMPHRLPCLLNDPPAGDRDARGSRTPGCSTARRRPCASAPSVLVRGRPHRGDRRRRRSAARGRARDRRRRAHADARADRRPPARDGGLAILLQVGQRGGHRGDLAGNRRTRGGAGLPRAAAHGHHDVPRRRRLRRPARRGAPGDALRRLRRAARAGLRAHRLGHRRPAAASSPACTARPTAPTRSARPCASRCATAPTSSR